MSKMFKSLVKGFNKCPENKKDSGYRHIDSPTNSNPPAYSEKDKPDVKATAQAIQQHESHVQVCPHESMSFERFQHIHDLLRDEGENRLDALSAMPKYHEDMGNVRSFADPLNYESIMYNSYQICRPKAPTSETVCVQGQAAYTRIKDGPYKIVKDGLELLSIWTIDFSHHQYKREAFTRIQDLLEPVHVWLCPHRSLHDGAIVAKVVSLVVPSAKDPDPVSRLEKDKELRQCQSCKSMFEFQVDGKTCSVKVTRRIKAKTSKDASWLAQCSKTEGGK